MRNGWAIILFIVVFFSSCLRHEEKKTYFGGKIKNPKAPYIYLYHNFLPFDKDTIPLGPRNRFGKYLNLDTPATFLFSQGNEISDLYIRPGDSLSVIVNMADFDRTINFSGSEIADFNNLLKGLGKIAIDQFKHIEPLLSKYTGEEVVEFNRSYIKQKRQLVDEFRRTHPAWDWTPKEQTLIDYNTYLPDLYLYEKFNTINRGRDTIHYEMPFRFDWNEKHPMSYFLGLWTKQYLINHVADADINDFAATKAYLQRIDSLIGDSLLADFAKHKLVLSKLEKAYPNLNIESIDSLNDYLDTVFSHPEYADHVREYIRLFLREVEGKKALNLLLVSAKNCDSIRLYDLLAQSPDKYLVLVPIANFMRDCSERYEKIESLRNKYKNKYSFYYLYKKLPSGLKESELRFKPDYFYWIYPTSEFFHLYGSYIFKKSNFFVIDKTGTIRKIYTPVTCKTDIGDVLDSLWAVTTEEDK